MSYFPLRCNGLSMRLPVIRQSSRDALTGLLVRRAFYQSTYGLLLRRREGPKYFGAAMIDLDSFKRLNDTQGHATGDQALARWPVLSDWPARPHRLSRALAAKNSSSPTSTPPTTCTRSPNIYCNAVGATRYPITASIGIVCTPLGPSFDPVERELINDLVNVADTAMYAAKRAGGNQSRSTRLDPSPDAAFKGSAAKATRI